MLPDRDETEGRRVARGFVIGCICAAVLWVIVFTAVAVWILSK
jgi:hypothetical protein